MSRKTKNDSHGLARRHQGDIGSLGSVFFIGVKRAGKTRKRSTDSGMRESSKKYPKILHDQSVKRIFGPVMVCRALGRLSVFTFEGFHEICQGFDR